MQLKFPGITAEVSGEENVEDAEANEAGGGDNTRDFLVSVELGDACLRLLCNDPIIVTPRSLGGENWVG